MKNAALAATLIAAVISSLIVPGSAAYAQAQTQAQGNGNGNGNRNAMPKYEFRGAWIATVLRLDWPPSAAPALQQKHLIAQLDSLKGTGINAVFFQVRPESDALYESSIEPWSFWLTGEQGKPPDPFYDPLEFAVDEAHKRGMELHAWFNPYRVVRGSAYRNSLDHISIAHPDWILTFRPIVPVLDSLQTADPGLPEVREYIVDIVADVAMRYDIDGIHFDDYFYPYPTSHITNEDAQTFADHNRGFTDLGDWRRDNVNLLIQQVSDTLAVIRPDVKFGIAPFGIWKNGVPTGIVGLDAYNVIYADAVAWFDAQSIDYLIPLTSWAFGGRQDYGKLAPWWAEQRNGRHVYTAHGAYRADPNTYSGTKPFSATEIPNQIRFNRNHDGIMGSVFFRAKNLTLFKTKGLSDSLSSDFYRYPALTPPMAWKDQSMPPPPQALTFEWTGPGELTLSWVDPVGRYTVYRVEADAPPPDLDAASEDPSNLIALTGETTLVDRPDVSGLNYYYFVRSASRNSIESVASNVVAVAGTAVATENEIVPAFALSQNYPNPFSRETAIEYRLVRQAVVTLQVFDVTGRLVNTLVRSRPTVAGSYTARWDGTDLTGQVVPAGSYFYSLEIQGRRFTRGMVRIR